MSEPGQPDPTARTHEQNIQELWQKAGEGVHRLRDKRIEPGRYVWADETQDDRYRLHRNVNSLLVQLQTELTPYFMDDRRPIDTEVWTEHITTVTFDDDRIREALGQEQQRVSLESLEWWSMNQVTVSWVDNRRMRRAERKDRDVRILLPPNAIQQVYQQLVQVLHQLGFATPPAER